MSKNVFVYSFRFMAVLMAAVMFASCEKDTFTEANALNLELRKLRLQDSIATAKTKLDQKNAIQLLQYQRQIDSLAAIDAGGKVYYTVVPVSATNAVWTSGGRTEDVQGLEGATVTVSQYGQAIEATNPKNGVYTFPVLHSGEVTVTIKAPNHGTVNYIANLTPDGPVGNGKIVYVGNVIAMFETSTDAAKMATIKGKAWVETDLTNGTEEIPQGTSLTANIDAAHSSFRKRFIDELSNPFGGGATDESNGVNLGNQNTQSVTRSGYIQKMAYESAVSRAVVGADGSYSILSPSTGAGLPIKMEFSEYEADRTFYREGQKVTARFVYGPNVKSDMIPYGGDMPTLTFKAFTTEATATGTYTKAVTSGTYAVNTTRQASWGRYVSSTVTVEGTAGSGAVGAAFITTNTHPSFRAFGQVNPQMGALNSSGVRNQPTGTGYTSDGTIVYTFTDHTALGTAKQLSTSTGTGIAQYVRVKNGGSGFIPTGATTSTTTGIFTNRLPKLEFLVGGTVPVTGSQPDASVVIDQSGIGTISFVQVNSTGTGFTAAPTVRARYAFPSAITITGSANNGIFRLGADSKSLEFNVGSTAPNPVIPAMSAAGITQIQALAVNNNFTTTNTSITFAGGSNSVYTFVPAASVIAAVTTGAAPVVTTPQIQVTVNTDRNSNDVGRVNSISMTGGDFSGAFVSVAPFSTAISTNVSISLTLAEPTNSLDFYPTDLLGSGLNNYLFSPTTPPTSPVFSNGVAVPGFTFASAGLNTGNTSTQQISSANALDLITANEFIVVATAPTATVSNPSFAYGVPVWDNGAIAGIRLLWGGSGYVSGTDYSLEIMPNPFYNWRGGVQLAGNVTRGGDALSITGFTVPSNITIGTVTAVAAGANSVAFNQIGTAARAWVEARYNRSVANKQAASTDYVRVNTPAKLTITLTNQGSGYAGTPVIAIYAGDRLVTNFLQAQNDIRVIEGGKVALRTGSGVNNLDSNNEATGLTKTYDLADAGNQDDSFDWHGITTVKVFIFDRLSNALTTEFNNRVAAGSAFIDLDQTGKINGIHLSGRAAAGSLNAFTSASYAPMATRIDWNYAPSVTISAPSTTGGVTATATVLVSTDNGAANVGTNANGTNFATVGTSLPGSITGFTVTNGGSGYVPGNIYYNRGTNRGNIQPVAEFNGQDFRIIGGTNNNNGGVGNGNGNPGGTNGGANTGLGDNGANGNDYHDRVESNIRFDVFTGITYIRDIHYGTGKEVE